MTALAVPGPAQASPRVVADIPPVHGLVARVMAGVGKAALLIPAAASPHGRGLRPSEAALLDGADLVVWIGPALSPGLARAVASLAGRARLLTLLEVPGTRLLEWRAPPLPDAAGPGGDRDPADGGGGVDRAVDHARDDAHDHARDHARDDAHDHADDDGHDHAHDHARDDGHDHARDDGHDDGQDHAHAGPVDPHAWLDPANARTWVAAIAESLAALDPANAARYRANAAAAVAELAALEAELAARLAPLRGAGFVVMHDAYRYFEARFGIAALAALSPADAASPGAARLGAVADLVARGMARCILIEPQLPDRLAAALAGAGGARLGRLDPLGADIEPGPGHYPAMLRRMAADLAACIDGG
ncbi:MAG: zinc transporter [Alphaproteobacteria bacterium]|nr:MAG: zinc transporter [Alphaproteobacteria bacterium]